jgi:hypothetical protein
MSFFNPQVIPVSALRNYTDCLMEADGSSASDGTDHAEDIKLDLHILRGYSLVSMTTEKNICEMHPLVQFCTRLAIFVRQRRSVEANLSEDRCGRLPLGEI